MEDKFALDGDEILAPMLDFVFELLLEPVTEGGAFSEDFVESEKKNLISIIESEFNDKRAYAGGQLLKNMCREDSFGLPRLGEKEDVEKITARSLYAHYRAVLETCPVMVFYVGSAEPETVAQLLQKQFGRIERAAASLPPQTALRYSEESHTEESQDVAQAKLCMGFVTPVTNRTEDFAAMQVLNAVFGGGMTSKLFMNVREKLSLCYSVGSMYYSTKGLITVSAGVEQCNVDIARQEILAQLQACKDEDITDEELAAAKEGVLSALRTVHDSPGAIEGYYAIAALGGLTIGPQVHEQMIGVVTKEDVARVAKTLFYHSSFVLKAFPRGEGGRA